MGKDKDIYQQSVVRDTVTDIIGGPGRRSLRQMRAMQYSRDVLKAIADRRCTDVKFTVGQLLRLWRKLGLLR